MRTKVEVMKDLARVRRRKIIIQKKVDGFDEIGNPVEIWANWKTLRVEQSSLWGQEYYVAQAVGEENTIVFTAKWVSFLDGLNTVEYRILFEGVAYDIKNIDPLQDDGTWVKIKARERPADSQGIQLLDHKLVTDLVALVAEIIANPGLTQEEQDDYEGQLNDILGAW